MTHIQNFVLQPAKFRLDGGAMFGIIPRPMWSKVAPPDDQNRIDLALRLWLIKDGDSVILIDTGIGDYHGDKFEKRFDVRGGKDPLELSLNKINLTCDDITDLVLSHLHFDHVGGINTIDKNGDCLPVFKNATLHLHKNHYDYSLNPTERDGGSFHTKYFKPIIEFYEANKRVHWLEGDNGTILRFTNKKSLDFTTSNGHTPFLLHPYSDEYIYLADIIPTSNHVHIPWVMAYDINPAISTQDKKRILELILEKDLKIIFEHDPLFLGASVKKDERQRIVVDQKINATEQLAYKV